MNAIDGTVNLSTYSNLPQYPTTLEFGESYKIAPNLIITLGPMTKGLINDVFLTIEAPADEHQKKILENVIRVLEMLPPNPSSSIFSKFVSDHSYKIPDNETERDCLGHGAYVTTDWEKIKNFSSNAIYSISKTDISSIGAFYTLIALNLAFLESCYQTENYDSDTIFTGNQSYQIEATRWHRPEMTDDMNNESPIFGVYDLKKRFACNYCYYSRRRRGNELCATSEQ
uniref:uncharacterized protein LOC120334319 isoform X2 n=1 Tax=Styela clava TaxID=7725 RepID=UPI00193943C5|nr:uncharacterized protein LOC120334319 isoform X2 [Styela clava]XP_039257732.1 uncharacterized protein LOC120334319 isoform X2 [Styela clava]